MRFALVALFCLVAPVRARATPLACPPGRFGIAPADGAALAAALSGPAAGVVELTSDGRLSLGSCTAPATVRARRRRTRAVARFEQCGAARKIRLRAVLRAPACDLLHVRVTVRGRKAIVFDAPRSVPPSTSGSTTTTTVRPSSTHTTGTTTTGTTNASTSTTVPPGCGDGVVNQPGEQCDGSDAPACPGACDPDYCRCASPVTDACADPLIVTTFPAVVFLNAAAATREPTDPEISCTPTVPRTGDQSVWHRVTAPATGRIRVSTAGSHYDTLLAAFDGACGALDEIDCTDDGAGIDFPVRGGHDYLVEAAAYPGVEAGVLQLTYEFAPCGDGLLDAGESCDPGIPETCTLGTCGPTCTCLTLASDECEDAPVETTLPLVVRSATESLKAAPFDPKPSCQNPTISMPHASAWFRFRAPTDGSLAIDTSGSSYDTVLAVYTGPCGALHGLACDDDEGDGWASRLEIDVTAGTDYTLLVVPWGRERMRETHLSIRYLGD